MQEVCISKVGLFGYWNELLLLFLNHLYYPSLELREDGAVVERSSNVSIKV